MGASATDIYFSRFEAGSLKSEYAITIGSSESSLSSLPTVLMHGWVGGWEWRGEKEKEREGSPPLRLRPSNSILMPSFNLNYLLKALTPNPGMLGVRASIYELGATIQSIAIPDFLKLCLSNICIFMYSLYTHSIKQKI